jgi:hypothetical protein
MSARIESKWMTNHNTPQLSRMDLANHCAASPELSRLNTRAVHIYMLFMIWMHEPWNGLKPPPSQEVIIRFAGCGCINCHNQWNVTHLTQLIDNIRCDVWNVKKKKTSLVGRVPGYRSRYPRFDSWCYQIFWEVVGLESGSTQPHEHEWVDTWKKK